MGGKLPLTPKGWCHFIGTMEHVLTHWPEDLVQVFAAIELLVARGHLSPEALQKISSERGAVLEGHSVRIHHEPRAQGQPGRYTIEIYGDRWIDGGRWTFRSGELVALAKTAHPSR